MAKTSFPESPVGRYAALPHEVIDSPAFQGASGSAVKLVIELARQHTGSNNGRLQATFAYMARRGGFSSPEVLHEARTEAKALNLIVETRPGGLGTGPTFFALTWLPVSIATDLPHGYRRGAYALLSASEVKAVRRELTARRKAERAARLARKQTAEEKKPCTQSEAVRYGIRSHSNTESEGPRPSISTESVSKTPSFENRPTTESEHNEPMPVHGDGDGSAAHRRLLVVQPVKRAAA